VRVLVIGGKKVNAISNVLDQRFKGGTVKVFTLNYIDQLDDFTKTGEIVDRVVVIEESFLDDNKHIDEDILREKVNNVLDSVNYMSAGVPIEIIYITSKNNIARVMKEEMFSYKGKQRVILYKRQYTVVFFISLVRDDIYSIESIETKGVASRLDNKNIDGDDTEKDITAELPVDKLGGDGSNVLYSGDELPENKYEFGDIEIEDDYGDDENGEAFKGYDDLDISDLDDSNRVIGIDSNINRGNKEKEDGVIDVISTDEIEEDTEESLVELPINKTGIQGGLSVGETGIDVDKVEDDIDNQTYEYTDDYNNNESEGIVIGGLEKEIEGKKESEKRKDGKIKGILKNIGGKKERNIKASKVTTDDSGITDTIGLIRDIELRRSSIVFTGTPNSGTSTLAFNVARSIAQMGFNVLLVDCDGVNRPMAQMNREMFDIVHTTDETSINLLKAIGDPMNISMYTHIVSQGLHVLTMGLNHSSCSINEKVDKQKFTRFAGMVRETYSIVIYDMPFDVLMGVGSEVGFISDKLVVNTEENANGIMRLINLITNINNDDMIGLIINKSKVVLNKSLGRNIYFGKRVRDTNQLLDMMDEVAVSLGVDMYNHRLMDLSIVSKLNYIGELTDSWMSSGNMNNELNGEFLRVLKDIVE